MCQARPSVLATLKDCEWGYLVFHKKRLEPRVMPWQQHSRCHSVSFVMYISGAKFGEHCPNISGDMIECCTVLVEPPRTSSLFSFA